MIGLHSSYLQYSLYGLLVLHCFFGLRVSMLYTESLKPTCDDKYMKMSDSREVSSSAHKQKSNPQFGSEQESFHYVSHYELLNLDGQSN